jgi:hypothetical protein
MSEFSKNAMVNAISANFIDFRLSYAALPQSTIVRNENLIWLDSGVPKASWNGILKMNFPPLIMGDHLEKIKQYFLKKHRPYGFWLLPSERSDQIEKLLISRHFSFQKESPGMARELSSYRAVDRVYPSLVIKQVNNTRELKAFAGIVKEGFGLDVALMERLIRILRAGKKNRIRHYIGYWENQAVSSGMLMFGADVAGIYLVSTLNEFRGKGLGTLMTDFCLKMARNLGFTYCVLHASPEGQRIYERLGFRSYFNFKLYVYGDI